MDSSFLQWLLIVSTLLGGLAALSYFNDKFRLATWGALHRLLLRGPNVTVSPSTLGAYVNTHPRPRDLDKVIASDFDCSVSRSSSDWGWLNELTQALDITTIRELDRVVRKRFKLARLLARSFQAQDEIEPGHGVHLVLDIEAMERKGLDGFIELLSGLKLTAADAGYAKELWDDYQRIVANGA